MKATRQSSIKVGDCFGLLEVIAKTEKFTQTNPRRTLFLCRCSCGVEKEIDAGNLKKGSIKSCGHLKREMAVKRGMLQRSERTQANIIYHGIKHSAVSRGLAFKLTFLQARLATGVDVYQKFAKEFATVYPLQYTDWIDLITRKGMRSVTFYLVVENVTRCGCL